MALAKIGGLEALFLVFPKIFTSPAVFEEVVTAGHRIQVSDAALLEAQYEDQRLEVFVPKTFSPPVPRQMGRGEVESICLAIELEADYALIDDLDARHAAVENFLAAGTGTEVKGTLGVIVTATLEGHLTLDESISLLKALDDRPDIWISSALIDRVIEALRR